MIKGKKKKERGSKLEDIIMLVYFPYAAIMEN